VVEEAELPEVEVEEEFSPIVVRGHQFSAKPISVEEAILLLREKDWDFVLFPNTKSGRTTLVHLRADGNFGLVRRSELAMPGITVKEMLRRRRGRCAWKT